MRTRVIRILMIYLVGISIMGVWFSVNPRNSADLRYSTGVSQDDSQMLDLIRRILRTQPEDTMQGGNLPGTSSVYPVPKGDISGDQGDTGFSRDPLRSDDPTVISGEIIGELEKKVSLVDRLKVVNILRKRLAVSDLARLTTLATGGITQTEKEEVSKILHTRLSPQEYNEVRSVLWKYTN